MSILIACGFFSVWCISPPSLQLQEREQEPHVLCQWAGRSLPETVCSALYCSLWVKRTEGTPCALFPGGDQSGEWTRSFPIPSLFPIEVRWWRKPSARLAAAEPFIQAYTEPCGLCCSSVKNGLNAVKTDDSRLGKNWRRSIMSVCL